MKFIVLAAVLCRLGAAAPINANVPVNVASPQIAGDVLKGADDINFENNHVNGGLNPLGDVPSVPARRDVESKLPVQLDTHNIHAPVEAIGKNLNAEALTSVSKINRRDGGLEEALGNVDVISAVAKAKDTVSNIDVNSIVEKVKGTAGKVNVDSTVGKAKGAVDQVEGVASGAGVPKIPTIPRDDGGSVLVATAPIDLSASDLINLDP
ncbi:hypothetical protein FQN54_003255 [Arachnomyces sp. PD_36]|nr:hypothetical protein FQN54_003255 [Arachnomyces sp. PD_36]